MTDSVYYKTVLPPRTLGQFSQDPFFQSLVNQLGESYDISKDLTDYIAKTFNLELGEGVWLDLIGRVIGISRTIPFFYPERYFGFDGQPGGYPFDTFRIRRASDPLGDSITFPDYEYRFILKAKAVQNSGGVTLTGVTESSQFLFETDDIHVESGPGANITVTVPNTFENENLIGILEVINLTSEAAGIGIEYVMQAAAVTIDTHASDNQTVTVGDTATFQIDILGDPNGGPITYQWFESIDAGVTWLPIPGETADVYVTPPVLLSEDGYQYYCEATNNEGSDISRVAVLTVTP